MQINQAALNLIKMFEGLELEAYLDPVGIWTIGYGHTGNDVKEGMSISEKQANDLLQYDSSETARTIARGIKVPVNENEFGALVSLAYNIGSKALLGSTALARLNAEDRMGAADAIEWWNKATVNGQLVELPGLTRRRAAEKGLFLTAPVDATPPPQANVTLPETTRLAPTKEQSARRENIGESRSIQGAGTAAAAGGAAAAAVAVEKSAESSEELSPQMERITHLLQMIPDWAYWAVAAIVIISSLYVIYARVDDWRNHKR